ncbi:DUF2335 domain-containing protein [Methylobacterium sp. J-092]|uniref:DUF2335 domain-containing protein n=1 Tax=Methylobacterium sp. J-092 TaxID=2836667 RepID=UPI001FB94BB5|nr:DUF2335 domain-containing protein [Methylobacterium sp. J-092]MCJ2009385.1 DUF2335 domain-containing protein [Methylobacterium sp. J-092]
MIASVRVSRRPKGNPPARQQPSQDQQPTVIERNEFWQGPLPPPIVLDQFRQLVPDAPERIFAMWEQEAQHRRELEKASLNGNLRTVRLGQWAAIAFSLSALAVAALALALGYPSAAMVIGALDIAAVVGAFLYVRTKNGQ